MPARTPSLSSTRLVALYVLLVALGVGSLLVGIYLLGARALQRDVDAVILAESQGLMEEYESGGLPRLREAISRRGEDWGRIGALYLLADASRRPLAGNLHAWPDVDILPGNWIEFDVATRRGSASGTHPVRARIYPLARGETLLVGTDVREHLDFLARLRLATIWGVALTTLLVAALGAWYALSARRRVRDVVATCAQVMGGDLARRIPLTGHADEFDELAVAVNRMLERIEQQTGVLRTTFDSAAHDLRAPLHRLRVRLEESQLEGAAPESRGAAVSAALGELDRVQRTLATLLQIGQAESRGATTRTDRIDLATLAREIVELYAPVAREKSIGLTCAARGAACLLGNQPLMAQLLSNLIENVLRHVPGGHRAEAIVQALDDGVVRLIVADDGPGIAPEDRERVMRPFEKGGGEGSGLGLSLVASIVRFHEGRIELADQAPGLRVTCNFPAAPLGGATQRGRGT